MAETVKIPRGSVTIEDKKPAYFMVYSKKPFTGQLNGVVMTTDDENEAKRVVAKNNDDPNAKYQYAYKQM